MEWGEYTRALTVERSAVGAGEMVVDRPWRSFLAQAGLDDPQRIWARDDGEVVKRRDGLEVRRLVVAGEDGEVVLFLKKHVQPVGANGGVGEGMREFANYRAFRRRGLATAVPLAAGAHEDGGELRSFVVTRDFRSRRWRSSSSPFPSWRRLTGPSSW